MDHNKMHNDKTNNDMTNSESEDTTQDDMKKTADSPSVNTNEEMLAEMKKNDEKSAPTVTGPQYPWAAQGTPVIQPDVNEDGESK